MSPKPMEAPVPYRLKPIMSALLPTSDWPWWAIAIQTGCAAIASAFFSLPAVKFWLVIAVAFDLLTGLGRAIKNSCYQSRMMAIGGFRKFLILAITWIAYRADWNVDVAGVAVSLGAAVGVWYIVAELGSIAENLDDLGVKLPPFLKARLAKTQEQMNDLQFIQPVRPPASEEK